MVELIADTPGKRATSITGPKIDTNEVHLFYPDGKFKGADVLAAVRGHVLAQASVTGTYSLNPKIKA